MPPGRSAEASRLSATEGTAAAAMAPRDAAAALLVMVLWGLNFVVAKVGLEQLPPIWLVALRFAVVAVILVPFVARPRGQLWAIYRLSLSLGVLHFALMFSALNHLDAAVAAICIQIQVPFSALLAALFLGDRLGWRRAVGMAVALAGVVILMGEPRQGSETWAIGLILAAALVWSVAALQIKHLSSVDGLALNGWLALFTAPQLALVSAVLEDGQLAATAAADWRAYGSILYQSLIVMILCYGIWYALLRRYPVNMVMPWTLLVPLFGVAAGILLLGEAATWSRLIGGAVTVFGVAMILVRRPRLAAAKEQTV